MNNEMNRKEITIAAALLLLLLGTAPATAQVKNIGLRTNLLSWAMASPALGVDVQWNNRWQATLDGHISLMSDDPDNGHARYLRVSGAGAEVRRYFETEHHSTDIRRSSATGSSTATSIGTVTSIGTATNSSTATSIGNTGLPFHGAYLALGARYLKFDHLLFSDTGREGIAYTAGLTVGYTFFLPARWTVDAAIGAGYRYKDYTRYEWYKPVLQNRFLNEKSNHSFGITHAEVSLVYHFKF